MSMGGSGWLHGAVAVVTGASRGIGRSVAEALVCRGARVGLVARDADALEEVAASCERLGGGIPLGGPRTAVLAADASERAELLGALAGACERLGPVDVLVNNAGAGSWGRFDESGPDDLERLFRLNVLAPAWTIAAVLPEMRARGRGAIVNVASVAGRMGSPYEAAYSATKFALAGLTEAAALEAAGTGVRFVLVNPGPVATGFFEARGHPYARRWPRPVAPERVATALVRALERNGPTLMEVFVPRWLRLAYVARVLMPRLYEAGASRGAGPS
jgi:short-subunit dehydrogenase